ncbi:Neu5Ac permease (plasmid) [Piscirickettsia salmonis]|uniref:C4-dicarboxylate ABC transporter n=1 Tax=Piscirickettsia salmonis TaxID=1238 RepID=A0AAC8VIH6_PISSA|nr:TRAP transporter permease [Piscirickettsia salmonis]AKP74193.2 C4-dicarboxylate ABC transporter [Piscirickettsia salmonis LF-89 = ATCC VR-1361]ALB23082.1 C4-dicarboxylate ABC transporter [Piscirickettsia salmonis]ALY03020.1 C4-dicarboxylate ABC transporter [Piscirickettsia salmonis]AMA42578.1 C4-dicarboxylate ABC transporter [Piscirickettsia salmonis]AOS35048.1 C4-dicarboxylate ABC transporter [Piscirickettsia salmonis]
MSTSQGVSDIAALETGSRHLTAWQKYLALLVAVAWSVFQVYAAMSAHFDSLQLGAIHLGFAFALTFLVHPFKRSKISSSVPWYDWLFLITALAGCIYIAYEYIAIITIRGGVPNDLDVIMGTVTLIMLAIAVIRVAGPALTLIASVMVLYALLGPGGLISIQLPDVLYLHNGYSWTQVVQQLYLTTEGIWGTPLRVSATFVFLFVLFGALLERAGAGEYFIQLSYSVLGGYRGGPAKAAVVGSMMTGVISGSSISNVVTTGTFTIPLMKKVGYSKEKAAAIEVASSVNGQLTPPVMGAAAFIMADFLGVPYSHLILYALLPALLSYAGLLYVVHLEALKLGLKPTPRHELPPFWSTFISGVHYFIPIIYLLFALIIQRKTPEYSALNAIFILMALMIVQDIWRACRHERSLFVGLCSGLKTAFWHLIKGFEMGARNMTPIAIATAVAGIVVGIVTMTGLGFGLTDIVAALSGGNFYIVLVLAAIASLVLGLGLPTTANYIVMAALVAPVIQQLAEQAGMHVPLVAIHLFVFYFGILADDTPPVGLAAYAGAAIAKANPINVGVKSFGYDLRTVILPFIFILNPQLLMIGVNSAWDVIHIVISALIGMLCFVAALQGYFLKDTAWYERVLLLAAAFCALVPGVHSDGIGLVILITFIFIHSKRHRLYWFK